MDDEMLDGTILSIGPLRLVSCLLDVWRTNVLTGRGYQDKAFLWWLRWEREWKLSEGETKIPRKEAIDKLYEDKL